MKSRGDGSFEPAENLPAGTGPNSLTTIDVDADGDPDIVVAVTKGGPVSILRNNGDGTFQSNELVGLDEFDASALPLSVATADFDGDDIPDLAIANGEANSISILRNQVVSGGHRMSVEDNETFDDLDFGIQAVNTRPTLSLDAVGQVVNGQRIVTIAGGERHFASL